MEASATTFFCLRRSNSRLPVLTAGPRLAGEGVGGRCGEDNREDLRVRLGWLLCNISGLLPMSRFASAFPKQNVACVVTTSALLHRNIISCVIRDKYMEKERWRIEKITRLGSLLCRVDGVEVEWQSAMRSFFQYLV